MAQIVPKLKRLTFNPHFLIGLCLFLAGLYAYTDTLAPTVLDGDAALFQYTPYVLGVTYPTGYPLYLLLGKLWLTLFPIGEIAWRMNLFSALTLAAVLPLIYGAARRLFSPPSSLLLPTPYSLLPSLAALTAALTFATLPTTWRWATEAKIYGLNILLFSGVLYTLARLYLQPQPSNPLTPDPNLQRSTFNLPLLNVAALLLGLQITVHSTTVLLIPGLFLFVWLNLRHLLTKKSLITSLLCLILPGLLYLYIPLRGEWLIAHYGRDEAIQRGLLADFYHSGLAGWIRYFTAADFTGGVVTNWGQLPQQFITVYLPILTDEFTALSLILGVMGGLGQALTRPRLFWPLFLLYAAPIPFVLTYGQGEQSAFLLPSFLIFSIFVGNFIPTIIYLIWRITASFFRSPAPLPPHSLTPLLPRLLPYGTRSVVASSLLLLLFLTLISLLILPQIRYNLNWLKGKWTEAIYDAWADALAHPLAPGSAMLAHWGDLTSFWYMQHAAARRPDMAGLYPPTEAVVEDWLAHNGRDLYIAGPLQGWAAGVEERYQLIPWGRLVRLAPLSVDPQTLLPSLPHPLQAVFNNRLRLLAADFAPHQAVDGRPYGVTLTWQTLANLSPETTLSLRLVQDEIIAAQLDDTLLSGWFPRNMLPAGQHGLSYIPLPIPLGTRPGIYRLQLVAYTDDEQPWLLADGSAVLNLGQVELTLPPTAEPPELSPLNPLPPHDFNGEIRLADYDYTVTRVGQGKGFGVKLLWQALTQPAYNYTLLAELVDAQGRVLRSVTQPPVGGHAPTQSWQPSQFVRDQIDLVLPASAPMGQEALSVQLSWLRPDGSRLPLRRWLFPAGESLALKGLEVTEKEERVFTTPPIQHPLEANFDNRARLLGYNTPLSESGLQSGLRFDRAACAAAAAACTLHFDFFWQGINEMDALYYVFIHVVNEQGDIVAQHDRSPGVRGKQPTTSWLPGEVITDPVDLTLPANLPPGRYTLRLGLYLPQPPQWPRLPLAGQPGDFVEVGVLDVTLVD
jgi:hypothetical protein